MSDDVGFPNGPEEKLELRLFPLHENLRYIDIANPSLLALRSYTSDEIPTKVVSYALEKKDSLESVQNQTLGKLEKFKENYLHNIKENGRFDFAKTYASFMGSAMGFIVPTYFSSDPRVILPIGAVVTGGVITTAACSSIKRRSDIKRQTKNINENINKFGTSAVERFEIVKDEELEDIYNAIINNEPLKITKPINNSYSGTIERMIRMIGSSVSPFPRDVYEQKLATYEEPAEEPLFKFSFNLRNKFKSLNLRNRLKKT